MKHDKLLHECDNFYKLAGSFRPKGKSLAELQNKTHIHIYRATNALVKHFKAMDYVTLSRKFAIGHAKHQVVIEEEDQHVLMARVPANLVFEALNKEEYFYDGPEVERQIIYKISFDQL